MNSLCNGSYGVLCGKVFSRTCKYSTKNYAWSLRKFISSNRTKTDKFCPPHKAVIQSAGQDESALKEFYTNVSEHAAGSRMMTESLPHISSLNDQYSSKSKGSVKLKQDTAINRDVSYQCNEGESGEKLVEIKPNSSDPEENVASVSTKPAEETLVIGPPQEPPKITLTIGPPPEPPTNCCMSGCINCVWIQYAEDLTNYYKDGGEEAKKEIEKIEDPNVKMFVKMELGIL